MEKIFHVYYYYRNCARSQQNVSDNWNTFGWISLYLLHCPNVPFSFRNIEFDTALLSLLSHDISPLIKVGSYVEFHLYSHSYQRCMNTNQGMRVCVNPEEKYRLTKRSGYNCKRKDVATPDSETAIWRRPRGSWFLFINIRIVMTIVTIYVICITKNAEETKGRAKLLALEGK